MNYDEVAKKIADDLVDPDPLSELNRRTKVAIAAALRLAANEAAWRGFDKGRTYQRTDEAEVEQKIIDELTSKYGPRPEGGTR